ncbi:BglG family transcription antiterminator [Enterococcus innesii]|uniref:BglG family transcription antiterminator n=1 Tax=Enterococcus innesii TaxID=2839759 RepID=UPI00232CBC94|nr:HTH domain-containing protein [Enterococcus innesii]MDC0751861.1 HTH domain-containing protein [Enterococcus innesii]MDC0775949.1 HTH domain-containing protein [Enterococcus innesii]MDC0778927.1 HTH domain-containing protein [Enterococcus innesii]MDC0782669.1 HTH domain-containing protein [Enterococcus innesii]
MAFVNRWYQILDLLITHKDISIIDLQKKLSSSSKTVKSSIDLLNEELIGIAKIVQRKKSYSIEVEDAEEFELILAGKLKKETDFNSASKRVAFILKQLIEEKSFILIDDLSEALGISRSTVYNDFRMLKKLLKPFDTEVVGTPNRGIQIKGSEFNLRLLYIYYVQDYFYENYLENDTRAMIQKIISLSGIPQYYGRLLYKVISISMKRIIEGNYLETIPNCYTNFIKEEEQIEQLIYHLETKYRVTLSQTEQDFLWFPLNLSANSLIERTVVPTGVEQYFKVMLKRIHRTLVLDINEKVLFLEMKEHLKYMINRIVVQAKLSDLFYGEIERQYPFAYELAKVGLQEIEEVVGRTIPTVEISYLALYFELALKSQQNEPAKKQIAVVCHSGRGTAMIIRRQLERVLGNDIRITHLSEEAYHQGNLTDYFAIFTTIPLKHLEQVKSPIIKLTNLFDDHWLRNEWEKAERLQSVGKQSILLHFNHLDPDLTYQKNVESMIAELTKEHIVDECFLERIRQREEKHATIFDSEIGFPHAINDQTDKIVLSIGVFKRKLVTPEGNIKLIFLLGIPSELTGENEQDLLRIYNELFAIAGNADFREEISAQENLLALKEWLYQKELII